MKLDTTPVLDPRAAADLFLSLLRLQPAWTPELVPGEGEPAWALFQIFARYMQSSIDRLNQAPDKNLLAFLDAFGIALIPPQPARAPTVFLPVPNAADSTIPARTRLSAKVPGRPAPIIFETVQDTAMAAARLTDLVTLWPAQDQYADHSADAAGKRPFTLFVPLSPVRHEFYLAHDTVFAFNGSPRIDIEFELAPPGNLPMATRWEFWDGQAWRPFTAIDPADADSGSDGTAGFTRSGILSLRAGCGASQPTSVNGIKSHWIRGRVEGPLAPKAGQILPMVERVRVRSVVDAHGMTPFPPDAAYADANKLDVSKVFYPFDQQPHTGSAFYLGSAAAFGKPGAVVTLRAYKRETAIAAHIGGGDVSFPTLVLEYWDGQAWANALVANEKLQSFLSGAGVVGFNEIPGPNQLQIAVRSDIAPVEVNGQKNWWMRMRIQEDNFVHVTPVKVKTTTTVDETGTTTINIITVLPPAMEKLSLTYSYQSPWMFPEHCLTFSDFQWAVHSRDVRWPGNRFAAFAPVSDATPAVYFGFDRPLPNDLVSLYFDIEETPAEGPPLVWEVWDGSGWVEIGVRDETGRLSRAGMLSFVPPLIPPRASATMSMASARQVTLGSALDAALFQAGDRVLVQQPSKSELRVVDRVEGNTVVLQSALADAYPGGTLGLAALPRFGVSRDWLRARLKDDGAPAQPTFHGVYLNAVWARQVETVSNEILGGGLGIPNQSFFTNKVPVLPGEEIEVRELDGLRANVEYPVLRDELILLGYSGTDLTVISDARTNRVTEVWVLWREKPHFYFSGPGDRHYVVERSSGRVLFGDGVHGRMPPPGSGNIRARRYQAGGGLEGNVPAGQINQIMSGVLASAVTNPRAAEGGADGETPRAVLTRGPNVFRHQERSLSVQDYETLAREASPAVAAARVLPATASNGRPAAGCVTIIIVPQSKDPRPWPSFELRQAVHDFLAARVPATVASKKIAVIGPSYLPVGVSGILVPRELNAAGALLQAALATLARFLHPLTGGPDGEGWTRGRGVFVSDIAALLEAIPGVDHTEFLELRLNDTPAGNSISVPPDRIVVAGPMRVEVKGT